MSLLLADDGDFNSPMGGNSSGGGNNYNSTGGWLTDAFEDGSTQILSDGQLEGFMRLLEEYATQLTDIEEAIQVSVYIAIIIILLVLLSLNHLFFMNQG